MLSSVLNGERAVRVNIEIVRTFVRLRRALDSDTGLPARMKLEAVSRVKFALRWRIR